MTKDKKNKKYYFTKDTENAIIEYCGTEETSIRTKLYIEEIQPAFNDLVDKIVYTYKFTNLENIDNLKGLDVEKIYKRKLGDILVFDRTNLHCSSSNLIK